LPGEALGIETFPHSNMRFIPEYGEGPYIFSKDGKKYLDYILGSGPLILGHSHPSIIKAVKEQVRSLIIY
ncbi:MAG: aminotransferase class III-fold pyridoxal phosphate-dependent enzyme, partial [Nitrososphaeria archaeon]|nr:aminotransferase class III-fold pyridoxal phosphate-dependent enzyme [Nitrososphaeria archaeon]NIQ32287.1 aminotransferase class III-fold pyridoxal phosphate-dependent enzyme [Nitrososphaeria archaeon]